MRRASRNNAGASYKWGMRAPLWSAGDGRYLTTCYTSRSLPCPEQRQRGGAGKMRAIAAVVVVVWLAGCSTAPRFQAAQAQLGSDADGAASQAVVDAHTEAYESCVDFMQSTRQTVAGSGNREVGLAAVGIVAGSIIVPALAAKASAAKSAIAGWGGVSGAANAAQYMLHQKGMSAAAVTEVYEQARTEIKEANTEYFRASNDRERMVAVAKLRQACDMPALPRLSGPTEPKTNPGDDDGAQAAAPAQPGSPAPAQPGSPAPAQPGSPAPAQPGSPAPAQPGSPAPAQPGSPAPAQPGSPTPPVNDPVVAPPAGGATR
jgi:hypothetical protein